MSTVNVAATVPINPSGSSPVLTHAQVWAGLQRKVRKPSEFVPIITSCDVVKDEAGVVERQVAFQGGKQVREVCTEYAPARVHFAMDNGSEVQNIISAGSDGELYLTYAFKWKFPDLAPESDQFKEEQEKQQKMAVGAVSGTIKAMRAMVTDGTIKA